MTKVTKCARELRSRNLLQRQCKKNESLPCSFRIRRRASELVCVFPVWVLWPSVWVAPTALLWPGLAHLTAGAVSAVSPENGLKSMWKGQKGVFPTGPPSALMVVQLGNRPSVLSTLQQVLFWIRRLTRIQNRTCCNVERTEGRFPDWTTISADGI